MDKAAIAMLGVFLGIPVLVLSVIWDGYVLSVLWGWFAVPAFGLPALSVPMAIGVSLVVAAMTNHRTGKEAKDDEAGFVAILTFALLKPTVALLLGWIVKSFV